MVSALVLAYTPLIPITTKKPPNNFFPSKSKYPLNKNPNFSISINSSSLLSILQINKKNFSIKTNYPFFSSIPDSLFVFFTSLALSFSLFITDVDSAFAFVVTSPSRRLQQDELATVRLFQDNTPSVVYITNLAVRQDAFTLDVLEVPQGSGSGFVWDKDGHIVTNYHVIRGASELSVTLSDQSTYEAKVNGFDQDKDVALLSIDAPRDKLKPIPVGVSANLLVGQKVYAIGNPFGLDHTLTTGVIRIGKPVLVMEIIHTYIDPVEKDLIPPSFFSPLFFTRETQQAVIRKCKLVHPGHSSLGEKNRLRLRSMDRSMD